MFSSLRAHRPRRLHVLVSMAALSSALVAGCGDDTAAAGGDPTTIDFVGESEIFPGLDFTTGLVPADSPVQASFSVTATGTSRVVATVAPSGSEDAPALTGLPDGGVLTLDGGFAMIGQLKVDVAGVDPYDGPIPGLDDVEIPIEGSETFDPFLIDGAATVRADIPAVDLPGIPLPAGLPGELVLTIADGSYVEQDFVGVCAGADGRDATYTGRLERRGSLVIRPRIDLEVAGFTKSFDIPEFTVDLALPGGDLAMTAEIEAFGSRPPQGDTVEGSCGGSGDGGAGATSSGNGQGGAGSTGVDTGATSTSTTGSSASSSSGGGGGLDCAGEAYEPDDGRSPRVIDDQISCNEQVSAQGVLSGIDDLDVIVFPSTLDRCAGSCGDADVCPTQPSVVHLPSNSPSLELCLFVECAIGDGPSGGPAGFNCLDGSSQAAIEGAEHIVGCCSGSDFSIDLACRFEGSSSTTQYVLAFQDDDICADYGVLLGNYEP